MGRPWRHGRSQVRVKRCGKSAPACGVTRTDRQTPSGARSSRGIGRPVRHGSPWRPRVDRIRWMATGRRERSRRPQNPAYRPTHHRTTRMWLSRRTLAVTSAHDSKRVREEYSRRRANLSKLWHSVSLLREPAISRMELPVAMSMDEKWPPARLIPVTGMKDGSKEQEDRASSAVLAVCRWLTRFVESVVRRPGCKSGAERKSGDVHTAQVRLDGKAIQPDGIIWITHGTKRPWVTLVEVKTGDAKLDPDQLASTTSWRRIRAMTL